MYEKRFVISLTKAQWQSLKKISYEENISMSDLIRQGVELILNKNSKKSIDTT